MSTESETVQPPRRMRTLYVPAECDREIQALADRELRSYSRQCETLIREALEARRAQGALASGEMARTA